MFWLRHSCHHQRVSVRCILVDDNAHFLGAARGLLEAEGIEVVAVATTSAEAVRKVADLQPTVTLVDVYLGRESGFDLARRLVAGTEGAQSKVILISTYAERDIAELIDASPAIAFLTKSNLSAAAIRDALQLDGT